MIASTSRQASSSAAPYAPSRKSAPSKPLAGASDLIIFPDFKHTELLLESRIKTEVQPALKLDADNVICKDFLSPSGCPRGPNCPLRHTTPSTANYVHIPTPTTVQGRTVCKHWLRGLCKKGADCEFLHEYNLRKMPECYFFTKHGFCSSGDECMYLHITPHQRRPECRSYTAGFCRAGECLLQS
jgi:cleavage and polyadenylation specificity factor subunit 4